MRIPGIQKIPFLSGRKAAARTAILMRTGDRAVFLRRALASVAAQTDPDWCLVVLNDGDRAAAETVVAPFIAEFPGRISLRHFPRTGSAGLGHLNAGVKASGSEFVAIHDDDDTWEPGFLEKSVAALRMDPGAAGSVTKAFHVREEVEREKIRFLGKKIYNEWQAHQISLFRLAESLTFPPISLVFRRSVLAKIGPFPAYPALLGDWEFCLRLFAGFPVAFIPEPLANYHFHGANESAAGIRAGTYEREGIELRNQLLREDLRGGRAGLGFWVNVSHAHGHLYGEIASLKAQLDRIEKRLAAGPEL